MASPDSSTSRLQRAVPASLFLVIALAAFYFMDLLSLIADFPPPSATGFIEAPSHDIKHPILERFHWIPFLDDVFRNITVGFAPSSFGYDDVSRWQMVNFLNEFGVIYMILLLESSRKGNEGTFAYYPMGIALLSQLGGGGLVIPIYFALFLVYCRPIQYQTATELRVSLSDAWLYLLLVLVLYTIPLYAMYFAPLLEDRHYWTWFWQLFPVRISMAYWTFQAIGKVIKPPTVFYLGYITSLTLVLGTFITMSSMQWLELLFDAPYSFYDIFFPAPNAVDTWGNRLKRILQLDQASIDLSVLIWLGFMFWDMKKAKILQTWEVYGFLVASILLVVTLGPGAGFGVTWLLRESWINWNNEEEEEEVKKTN